MFFLMINYNIICGACQDCGEIFLRNFFAPFGFRPPFFYLIINYNTILVRRQDCERSLNIKKILKTQRRQNFCRIVIIMNCGKIQKIVRI